MKKTFPLSFKWIALCLLLFPFTSFAQDATWFKDVTDSLGLKTINGGAVIGLDVNNDGYPDLLVLNGNAVSTGFQLYINQQRPGSGNPHDRVFVDSTAHSGLNHPGIFKDMASAGDFNNDGNVDIITNCWYMDLYVNGQYCYPSTDADSCRLHLFLGDGHGHFTLKQNSGLEAIGPMAGSGLPTLDYDLDGNLDVYVCTHLSNWCSTGHAEDHYLLKGNGDGTFTNVSSAAGISSSNPLALFGGNMADWNNDGYPDIITAPYESFGLGNLYQNNGNGTFTDVASAKNWNPHWMTGDHSNRYNPNMVPWAAMPCDYDNDGDIDFLVPLVHGAAGAGDGRTSIFTNGGTTNGYTLTPNVNQITRHSPQNYDFGDHNSMWTDFDHDMLVDLMIGDAAYDLTSNGDSDMQRMFFCLQDQSHHFDDITQQLGFINGPYAASIDNRIRRPSVMMPMDYDMDGDDDIFKAPYNNTDPFLVLRNNVANKKHYIEIDLVAPPGVNKSCIGARVVVKSGGVTQMREIYGGQGQWTTQWPFTLNFGLKDNTTVDSIDVRWPDATFSHTVVPNVPADQYIHIGKDGIISGVPAVKPVSNDFVLYPNPVSNGMLTVGFKNTTQATVNVYNAMGQLVYSYIPQAGADRVEIPVQNFQAGAYWVHVSGKDNSINDTKAFIKQ